MLKESGYTFLRRYYSAFLDISCNFVDDFKCKSSCHFDKGAKDDEQKNSNDSNGFTLITFDFSVTLFTHKYLRGYYAVKGKCDPQQMFIEMIIMCGTPKPIYRRSQTLGILFSTKIEISLKYSCFACLFV